MDPSDIDGNKDAADAMAANQNSNSVSVFINQGLGIFAPAMNIDVGASPVDVVARDFNGDGFDDFVTANNGDGTVSVVLNNGDGTFAPAVHLLVGALPRSLTVIDLEGDADLDIAVVADDVAEIPVVRVLRNDLSESLLFADAAHLSAGTPAFLTGSDLDNDGQQDLITIADAGAATESPAGPLSALHVQRNISSTVNCPCDCGGDDDQQVGIVDFLGLLGQWGMIGSSCDFDGSGVGIVQFLELLGNWGPCP